MKIKVDEDITPTITATMVKMHRSSIDPYITEKYEKSGVGLNEIV